MRSGDWPHILMTRYDVSVVNCGSPLHLDDVSDLRRRRIPVPHDYSDWPLHATTGTWMWCRVLDPDRGFITGFAIQLNPSRAVPGTRIGQVDRIGRELHEAAADEMGGILREAARRIPRLLRLDARIYDEDLKRRRRLHESFRAAGWRPNPSRRHYSGTLVLKLAECEDQVLTGLSKRVRSTIRKALGSPALRFGPIRADAYEERIRYLHSLSFARTGGIAPPIDVSAILKDSAGGETSVLIGAFACRQAPPQDLVALAWARWHGDHAVLEINASERSELVHDLSPGFGLIWKLLEWAIQRGAQWFDLGGLSSFDPAPQDPMRGVDAFKKRFSSDFREVAEEWQLDPNPLLATAASAVRSLATSLRRNHHALHG